MNERAPLETMINISRVRVGGDLGGLIAVVGTFVVLISGIPPVTWFVAAAFAGGTMCAAGLVAWHRHCPGPARPPNTIAVR